MITGQINDEDQAVVTLTFTGEDNARQDIECVVVTGFTGEIGLPDIVAQSLSLISVGKTETTVAGTKIETNGYVVNLDWHGKNVHAIALGMPVPCLGMGMLKGNVLIATVSPGQMVQITPLS